MPGMATTLAEIRALGLKLGIISNAQFYTAPILEAFCKSRLEQIGFDSQLSYFSYCFGRAKPDVFLYNRAAEGLADLGIAPEQVLYVGNHMAKDIVPAKTVGFKTGLFAGDQRSLRLDRYTPPLTPRLVDLILTDLNQIVDCLPKVKTQ
jgi:putative hydrolase of the HAD superfamily